MKRVINIELDTDTGNIKISDNIKGYTGHTAFDKNEFKNKINQYIEREVKDEVYYSHE